MDLFELSSSGERREVDRLPWITSVSDIVDETAGKLRDLRWLSSEPASELGHLSYAPAGALLHRLMKRHLCALTNLRTGAAEIATPILYRAEARGVLAESARFFEQMYHAGAYHKETSLVMRPGGDFGAFSLAAQMDLRLENLPLRVFECGPAFRRIQRGKVRGLRALRAFSLLDYHAFCANLDELWDELNLMVIAQRDTIIDLGFSAYLVLEVERSFFEQHEARICSLLKLLSSNAFVILLSERRNYWSFQHRFHDAAGLGLMDGQLDLENGSNYGIEVASANGDRASVLICHGSWGSVERWLWRTVASCGGAAELALPRWFAPIQLRLIPCSDAGADMARRYGEIIRTRRVRFDIDERPKTVSSRIRFAFEELVDTIVVLGDREAAVTDAVLSFRRADRSCLSASLENWITLFEQETGSYPFEPGWSGGLVGSPKLAS